MAFQDVLRSFTFFSQKVWNCTTLPKLSSKVSKLLSPEEDQSDKFLSCTQYESSLKEQETNGTCPQTNCYAEPKTQGKERIDDSNRVVQEKSHCAGNKEMSNSVGKNHKFSNLADLKSKQRKIDSMYIAAVCVLLLMYLPPGQGAALGEDDCGNFHSNLRNVTGPFSAWRMCEIRQQNTQCPMEYIGKCFPFVENNVEYYFSCIFNSARLSALLNDGQCILVTTTKGLNDFLAQCYTRDYCLPGNITSPKPATTNFPHVTLGSTQDPSTPNATNPLPDSLKKSTEPRNGFNWTTFIIVLSIAVVCFAIIVLFVRYIVPLYIGRFWIRHDIYNLVRC